MLLIPINNLPEAITLSVAMTLLHVVAVVQFAALYPIRNPSAWKTAATFFVSLLLWGFLLLDRPYLLHLMERHPSEALRLVGFLNLTLRAMALLAAAVTGGSLVARLIKTPNMLGPVCVIVALIDIWGVLFHGPVSHIMHNAPDIAKHAMSAVATPGAASHTAGRYILPEVAIGAGDYLFLGLLFSALYFNGMNWRAAVKWVIPLVLLALFGVMVGGWPLPGLPFIGLGIALPNLRYFEYTREEKFALLYASIFVVILTAFIYVGVVHAVPPQPPHRP